MTPELQAKLDRIKNYRTRYELALIRGDERILIRYTCDRSRRSVFDNVRHFGGKIVAKTGADNFTFAAKAGDGATCGEWSIRFTGRTQREEIIEGELPFIGN